MIKRIELTNFMSHQHTVIEPAPGLTVLVGPNNCGKSAVVAALQILCHNENSTYVLRHGEKECSVKVETDDGHTVEWRRKNSPRYVIDGVSYDRLGRGAVPEELHPVLRMPLVDPSGDADFDVHFGVQKSPIFLLASSPANAARFFASSSDAIQLVQIQKRHKEKLTEKQRQKNLLESESKQLTTELESLQEVADLERRVTSSELLQQELSYLATRLENLERSQAALAAQQFEVTKHEEQCHSLAPLAKPPELCPIEPLSNQIRTLSDAHSSAQQADSVAKSLAALLPPPVLFDVVSLAAALNGLVAQQERIASKKETLEKLSPLTPVPALTDTNPLDNAIADLVSFQVLVSGNQARLQSLGSLKPVPLLTNCDALQRVLREMMDAENSTVFSKERYQALDQIRQPPPLRDESALVSSIAALTDAAEHVTQRNHAVTALRGFETPPTLSETIPFAKLLDDLSAATAQQAACQAALSTVSENLSAAIAAIRDLAATSVCPTCGGPFNADRLMSGAIMGNMGHDHG